MFLIGNINHHNVSFFPFVLEFKLGGSILPVFASEIREVKQTAFEKFRLFLIAPVTDNHR